MKEYIDQLRELTNKQNKKAAGAKIAFLSGTPLKYLDNDPFVKIGDEIQQLIDSNEK